MGLVAMSLLWSGLLVVISRRWIGDARAFVADRTAGR